jgi:hypothetical protein
MLTFLVAVGMVLWATATIGLLIGGVMWAADGDGVVEVIPRLALGVVCAALSGTGVVMTVDANGWFEDATLPDGCYVVSHDTQLMPIMVGKVITVMPYNHTNFGRIPCSR